jgi:ribosome-associated protein
MTSRETTLSESGMTKTSNTIKLDQFLKVMGIVDTGGQAKMIIQDEVVSVNGVLETRRGRKLVSGDRVTLDGQTFEVDLENL